MAINKTYMELAEMMKPEYMPDSQLREIAKAIGCVNLVKLLDIVQGDTVYLPLPKVILRPLRDSKIMQEFNGYNIDDLANKYGLTKRSIRGILYNQKKKLKE